MGLWVGLGSMAGGCDAPEMEAPPAAESEETGDPEPEPDERRFDVGAWEPPGAESCAEVEDDRCEWDEGCTYAQRFACADEVDDRASCAEPEVTAACVDVVSGLACLGEPCPGATLDSPLAVFRETPWGPEVWFKWGCGVPYVTDGGAWQTCEFDTRQDEELPEAPRLRLADHCWAACDALRLR